MGDYLVLDHLSNLKRATIVRVSGHVITDWCKVLVMSSDFPQFAVGDFKIQRRGRQREHQKKKKEKKEKHFSRASHFFVHFFVAFARLRREKPNFALYGGRKQATTKFYFSL